MRALARNGLVVTLAGMAATGCALLDGERRGGGDDQGEDCDPGHQGDQDGDDECGGGDGDVDDEICGVVAMDPAPESRVATPLSSVTLTFDHAVDPGDVTVRLRERESRRQVVIGVASGADDDQLVLTPRLPLGSGNYYSVDVEGEACSYSKVFWVKFHIREDYDRNLPAGLDTYYRSTWDEDDTGGVRAVHWMGAGGDHIAGTEDDYQRDLSEYHYDERQDPVYMLNRSAPGDDGDYFTGDDVLRVERHIAWDGVGQQRLFHTDPGDDGAFGVGDDDFDFDARQRVYDADTDALLGLCRLDVGGDLTAFTGDDVITECQRYVELAGEERNLTTIAPGADGDWLTDDDELGDTYDRALLDADGAVVRRETHALAGDGTATPSPATLLEYTDIDRDANHLPIEERTFTGDDTGVERSVYTHDADGFMTSREVYRPDGEGALAFLFSRMTWVF